MNRLHRGSIALLACLLLLQLSTGSAGPVRSNRMTRVLPRSFGNIQRVARNDANVAEKYLQTRIADPVATTLEPSAPTTEVFSPVFDQETLHLSTKIQDDISPAVLPESDLIDEPAVLLSDVVEPVPVVEEEIAPEVEKHSDDHLPIEEVPAIAPQVEDSPVDLRIVAEEPLIVAIPTAAPQVPAFVHSEPVDVPLVDEPVSVIPTVSPAVPIFIASVLPLEPVESPEAVLEKVESEAPVYSPLNLPVLDPLPPASYPSSNPVRSELSSHFPNRPFGILPKARELGFPPVSNTRENVLREINWNAKIGRAYRSS
ncbi:magnetosome-associated protein MamJ-like isoform X4 [Daphnia pulex]|uniref:magnetosome-associated protein MamJ-like isoform X4 n=1 Tax=Daphnia pulex TaxID=6669 RepID=UPI001EDCFDC9|nr:magnetosome-associated protein MamJ-like isoform X4 [Daphnia pulex]